MAVLLEEPETVLSAYEIERGKPMPNLTHGAIQMNLGVELKINFGNQFRIASEVALATLPEGTTPDIVVYPKRELNFINEVAKQTEAPLLTIEIQSPSQSNDLMIDKAHQYFEFGVKSSWIVFPAMKGIAVYSAPNRYAFFHDDDQLTDPNLNITLDLKKIFA
ncbi:MAG: Uma2 family endonuclease [Spirosomataceae bacterium]